VVRERIKELIDFATTESPYRDANKGWLNDDVYLQWGTAPEQKTKSGVELANVSVFWNPINQLAAILLAVVLLASSFVFVAVSLSHGKVQISPFLAKESYEQVVVLETQVESQDSEKNDIALKSPTVTPVITPVAPPIVEKEIQPKINTQAQSEFAAAALGGQKK